MCNPKCPHCEHEFDDDQIWHQANRCNFPTERDGDTEDFNCPSCGNELHVQLELSPSWHFLDEDGEELEVTGE
jgi:competence CoiA-like predicted nuclease